MTYALLAPFPPKVAAKATAVAVTKAAFFECDATVGGKLPAISVSRPRVEDAEYTAVLGRHLKCSIVEIENTGSRPIDLVFRGRFDQPKDVDSLLAYRAPVGPSKWVVEDVPRGPGLGSWGEPEVTQLELVDWCEILGAIEPAPAATARLDVELLAEPAGPLAPRLREVWDAPYRYPDGPIDLSGRFRLDNPGTDAMWKGVKRLEGSFALKGFSGGRWTSYDVAFDAGTVPAALEKDLAAVLDDRFRMWFERDPAARRSFAEAFAGATATGTPDRIELDSGDVRRVEVEDGLPAALALESWRRVRKFDWTTAHGARVARTVTTGDETITVTWLPAAGAKGLVLPGRVELRDVFEDWGPEILEFSKWTVKRS